MSKGLSASERLSRLCLEVCPFRVGHRVTISPASKFASDWPEEYVITAIRWEYQKAEGHSLNISIAHDRDIICRDGDTDGWRVDDLLPAGRAALSSRAKED